jgi:hypothetical protein
MNGPVQQTPALSILRDVSVGYPVADAEFLVYDLASKRWINKTAAELGIGSAVHTHAHEDLTGLQGGTTSEYYHLTAAELAVATTANYTDEEAQDAVGGILTDSATVDFTYDDTTPAISASVIDNSSVQKIEVTKDSGAVIGTRKQLNFIAGAGVTITVTDDPTNDQIDITISVP